MYMLFVDINGGNIQVSLCKTSLQIPKG
jgi:hypothetical protein